MTTDKHWLTPKMYVIAEDRNDHQALVYYTKFVVMNPSVVHKPELMRRVYAAYVEWAGNG